MSISATQPSPLDQHAAQLATAQTMLRSCNAADLGITPEEVVQIAADLEERIEAVDILRAAGVQNLRMCRGDGVLTVELARSLAEMLQTTTRELEDFASEDRLAAPAEDSRSLDDALDTPHAPESARRPSPLRRLLGARR